MIDWLAPSLLASSLLMLFVLVIRRPVAHLFGPQLAYALWALPLLPLVLPPPAGIPLRCRQGRHLRNGG